MNAGHCSKTTNSQRFIPVNEITSKTELDVSICLPASHAISGCDIASSLFKIGKRTAYNTLVVNIADMLCLTELGQCSIHVNPPSFVRSLRHFGIAENLRPGDENLRHLTVTSKLKTYAQDSSSMGPSRKGYRTDANHQERNGRCIDERRGYPGEMRSVLQLANE